MWFCVVIVGLDRDKATGALLSQNHAISWRLKISYTFHLVSSSALRVQIEKTPRNVIRWQKMSAPMAPSERASKRPRIYNHNSSGIGQFWKGQCVAVSVRDFASSLWMLHTTMISLETRGRVSTHSRKQNFWLSKPHTIYGQSQRAYSTTFYYDQMRRNIRAYKGDRLILNIKAVVRPVSPENRSQIGW